MQKHRKFQASFACGHVLRDHEITLNLLWPCYLERYQHDHVLPLPADNWISSHEPCFAYVDDLVSWAFDQDSNNHFKHGGAPTSF